MITIDVSVAATRIATLKLAYISKDFDSNTVANVTAEVYDTKMFEIFDSGFTSARNEDGLCLQSLLAGEIMARYRDIVFVLSQFPALWHLEYTDRLIITDLPPKMPGVVT